MKSLSRKLVTYVLTLVIGMAQVSVAGARDTFYDEAEQPSAGAMLADTALIRPTMLVASVVGIATFVVTLPFSALGRNVDEAGKALVLDPLEYTFLRPLGDL